MYEPVDALSGARRAATIGIAPPGPGVAARSVRTLPRMRPQPTVITVGNFDGVHAGHRAILRRGRELAGAVGAPGGVAVLTFDPHPLARLAPERAPGTITPLAERTELLRDAGADAVHRLEPGPDLLGMPPEAFLEWVIARYNPAAFVEGPDFHFGKGRAGDLGVLRRLCEPRGIAVKAVAPLAVGLSDGTVVTASSSIARWLIEHGRVRDAWAVLTRPHRLRGEVVRGERRGRTLGYPTANLRTENLLPGDGVYAAWATLPDGSRLPAALSVGVKPQFHGGGHARTAEAFLLDAAAEDGGPALRGLPEYGWTLDLDLVGWVREQMRFDSVERLLSQMDRDCGRVREICAAVTRPPPATSTSPRPASTPRPQETNA